MKINKVEIQAFKSYLKKDDGTFDFTLPESGIAANFASIYAPNGFGKTSFFDAVDYAVTGKIGRFSRDVSLRRRCEADAANLKEKGHRQYLLRNKSAGKNDSSEQAEPVTEVAVHTSNRTHPFKSKYDIPHNGSVDYDFPSDCKEGTKFFEQMLLSQEAIDAFLRETTPDKRYKKFVEAVPELTGFDEQRRSVLAVKRDLDRSLKEVQEKVDETKALLKETKNRDNPIDEGNRLVSEINTIASRPLPQFTAQYSQIDHDELKLKLPALKQQAEASIQTFETNKTAAEYEKSRLLETQRNVEQRNKLKAAEAYLDQIIKGAERIGELESELKLVKGETEHFIRQQEATVKYLGQVDAFVSHQSTLHAFHTDDSKITDDIAVTLAKQKSQSELLRFKREAYGESQKNIERVKEDQNKTVERFIQRSKLKIEIKALLEQLNAYDPTRKQEQINALEHRIEKLTSSRVNVPLSKEVLNLFEESAFNLLLEYQQAYQVTENQRLEALKQLKANEQRFTDIQGQSSAIRALIEAASKIVADRQEKVCPVCQQDYDDVKQLQQRIANNPALGSLEKELTQQIQQFQNQVKICEESLKTYTTKFDELVDKQKEVSERQYKEAERDQNEQQTHYAQVAQSLGQKNVQIKELNSTLLNKSDEEYRAYVSSNLLRLQQQEAEMEKGVVELEKEHVAEQGKLDMLKEAKSQLAHRKNDLAIVAKSFDAFKTYLDQWASSLDFREPVLKEFFRDESTKWCGKIEECKTKSAELSTQVDQLLKRRAVADRDATSEQLVIKRENVCKKIIELNNELASFEAFLTQMSHSVPKDETEWEKLKRLIEQYINQKTDGITKNSAALGPIESLESVSQMIVGFRDPQKLLQQLTKLNTQLKAHELVIDALDDDKRKIDVHIRKMADAYFRTDLINDLYGAIDPHPEFTQIKFECNMDGDKPTLRVTAADQDDNDQVCPTLSFSSAQINVLALSIFLAQALTTKDDDGKDVDCIFIDDPVQSVDSINSLSFIDLMRAICLRFDKQIIVSTHDENFHELLKKKIPRDVLPAKYLKLTSFGKVEVDKD
jgi:exonuclease SbcC